MKPNSCGNCEEINVQLPSHSRRPQPVQPDANQELRHGELVIDPVAISARYRGKLLALSLREFRLLALFVANPDRLFSLTELMESMGKDRGMIEERTVDTWAGRLRRTLRAQGVPDPLRSVRSQGYVLDSIRN